MYPLALDLDASPEVANWRPLVHWLLAIPHWFILSVLGGVSQVLILISFFTVLFTRKIPDGIYRFQAMYLRYSWRTLSYTMFMREPYPGFTFEMELADPGDDPARFSVAEQGELNRWLPLVKWLLLVPHYIALVVVAIGALFVGLAAFFVVLFTGRWPEGMRNYMIGLARWSTRVNAYLYLMRDEYPPFSFD
jgi:hypothetical protein